MPRRKHHKNIRQLPSTRDTATKKYGRFQVRYTGKNGETLKAPNTFPTALAAQAWLAQELKAMESDDWLPPAERKKREEEAAQKASTTLAVMFGGYLSQPGKSDSTKNTYRSLFDNRISEWLGDKPVTEVTKQDVSHWYSQMNAKYKTPPRNAQAYTLLSSIFRHAVDLELIESSPCRIKGASKVKGRAEKELITPEQLVGIVKAMPEHYRLAVLVASACALRIGEWAELRASDVDLQKDTTGNVIGASFYISRAIKETKEGVKYVGKPKGDKTRWVAVPKSLVPALAERVLATAPGALLFPNIEGEWTDRRRFNALLKTAGQAVGRAKTSSHDLRHHGGTMFARSGATLKETMDRLGHSTTGAAMRYQHASRQRDQELADRLDMPADVLSLNVERAKRRKA